MIAGSRGRADGALQVFMETLAASQVDLPADAAKVLMDNLWELYDSEPPPVAPQAPRMSGAALAKVGS